MIQPGFVFKFGLNLAGSEVEFFDKLMLISARIQENLLLKYQFTISAKPPRLHERFRWHLFETFDFFKKINLPGYLKHHV